MPRSYFDKLSTSGPAPDSSRSLGMTVVQRAQQGRGDVGIDRGEGEIKIGGEMMNVYDVIVIGAGHAGCEAALAAARMGCDTLVLTMKLDHIALMPCNPSIGGPAKGHLAREVDALGGEMGRNTDKTFIQIRMLNTGRGPAVQALRAQSDKGLYASEMRRTLERQDGLTIREALVTGDKAGRRGWIPARGPG